MGEHRLAVPGSRWVDEAWWRDWLFWVGVVVGVTVVALRALEHRGADWFELTLSGLGSWVFSVAVVGFARTVVRACRQS